MDIIHADHELTEIGFVDDIDQLDAEISQETDAIIESNSFSLTIPDHAWERSPIQEGHYIYVPGTEFGGRVEMIRHSTLQKQVTVSGVTWRGAIYRKIIEPPTGEAYMVIDDEANAALLTLLGSTLGAEYEISDAASGIQVSRQFRYTNALTGIAQMLGESGAALRVEFDQLTKTVKLSAAAVADYSSTVDLSQDYGVDMVTTAGGYDCYNHIIALGDGELLERIVLHVYRLDDGTITLAEPPWAGTGKDRVSIYDWSSAESLEELQKGAEKRLLEIAPLNQIEIDPQVEGLDLNLGDIVGARDRLTGMTAKARVVGKILTMNNLGIKVETRVK